MPFSGPLASDSARYDSKKSPSFRESPSHVGHLEIESRLGQVVAEHAFVSGDVVTAEGFDTLRLGGRCLACEGQRNPNPFPIKI